MFFLQFLSSTLPSNITVFGKLFQRAFYLKFMVPQLTIPWTPAMVLEGTWRNGRRCGTGAREPTNTVQCKVCLFNLRVFSPSGVNAGGKCCKEKEFFRDIFNFDFFTFYFVYQPSYSSKTLIKHVFSPLASRISPPSNLILWPKSHFLLPFIHCVMPCLPNVLLATSHISPTHLSCFGDCNSVIVTSRR